MIKKLFKYIKNEQQDISDIEISSISNKSILEIELNHINTILQEKHKLVNNSMILLYSGLAILGFYIFKNLPNLTLIMNDNHPNTKLINSMLPSFMDLGLHIVFVIIILYAILIYLNSRDHNRIINRKSLILKEIKKYST